MMVPASLVLLLASTAGCVRFGSKPPERLLAVSTDAASPSQPFRNPAKSALYVDTPAVAPALQTTRVAVRDGANAYAYVKDAIWVTTPARQFEALLRHTIFARAGLLVLNPDDFPAQSSYVLHGELIDFGVEARGRQAIVTYEATLSTPDGLTIDQQRFTARVPVAKIDSDNVAAPISQAANAVAGQVADWIKALPK
jgi:cholesterol transport system auxiliary component